jgi:preprotein translocase subunit YajC
MTGSGLYGTVLSIDGDEVELEVAPGVTNRYARRAIVNVIQPVVADTPEVPDDASELTDPDTPSDSVTDLPAEDRTNGDDAR